MEKQQAIQFLRQAKEAGQGKKFTQSVDLIINLKDLDLKKTENQVDFYVTLQNSNGKTVRVCAFTGPELKDEAVKNCDTVISVDDFDDFKDKKKLKKLATNHEYFIAQANIMPQVATIFGRVLGPRGKMPNPKAGCVVPPKATLKPVVDRLKKTIRVSAKKDPVIHLLIGREDMDENVLADNITYVMTQVQTQLPQEANNIRNAMIKLTMGKPVKIQ